MARDRMSRFRVLSPQLESAEVLRQPFVEPDRDRRHRILEQQVRVLVVDDLRRVRVLRQRRDDEARLIDAAAMTVAAERGGLAQVQRHERLHGLVVVEDVDLGGERLRLACAPHEIAEHHAELFELDRDLTQGGRRLLSEDFDVSAADDAPRPIGGNGRRRQTGREHQSGETSHRGTEAHYPAGALREESRAKPAKGMTHSSWSQNTKYSVHTISEYFVFTAEHSRSNDVHRLKY